MSCDIDYCTDHNAMRWQANKLLEQRAYTDARTGLPNRSACKEILNNNEIISSPTACIIFDLNNLKFINDTMGHSAGDRLIVKFAGLLRSVFPEKRFCGKIWWR